MNCFVIMPFSGDFDDVYEAIKRTVERVPLPKGGQCFRLDETRPAGRITDRLQTELNAASLCVADLTGNKANVMWEVGYAMALEKPMIIVTQNLKELPFDLKDMQSLEYDRNNLEKTLCGPLRRMIIDTISVIVKRKLPSARHRNPRDVLIKELRGQVTELGGRVSELTGILSQAVRVWSPDQSQARPTGDESRHLASLEGAWIHSEIATHIYAAMVNDELVAPYCYGCNNRLTGVYFGWRLVGEHWFARFTWLKQKVSGFTFIKQESLNVLTGSWWYDEEGMETPEAPPKKSGIQATWVRKPAAKYPKWASQFIEAVRRDGLTSHLPAAMRRLSTARRSSSQR